jgi:hypothetical protein
VANPKAFTQRQIEAFERGAAHYEQRWILEFDPKTTTFEELFAPGYLKLFAKKLEKNAIIRVLSADGSIDFDLAVVAKRGEEVTVKLRPRIPQSVIDAAADAERPLAPLAAIAAA